jgi:hypothetical protein
MRAACCVLREDVDIAGQGEETELEGMSMSMFEMESEIAAVEVTDEELALNLADGRSLCVLLSWYPRLFFASTAERQEFHLLGDGYAIEWPRLDEHIGIEGLLAGRHSAESQKSLKRWLISRQTDGGSVAIPS